MADFSAAIITPVSSAIWFFRNHLALNKYFLLFVETVHYTSFVMVHYAYFPTAF